MNREGVKGDAGCTKIFDNIIQSNCTPPHSPFHSKPRHIRLHVVQCGDAPCRPDPQLQGEAHTCALQETVAIGDKGVYEDPRCLVVRLCVHPCTLDTDSGCRQARDCRWRHSPVREEPLCRPQLPRQGSQSRRRVVNTLNTAVAHLNAHTLSQHSPREVGTLCVQPHVAHGKWVWPVVSVQKRRVKMKDKVNTCQLRESVISQLAWNRKECRGGVFSLFFSEKLAK